MLNGGYPMMNRAMMGNQMAMPSAQPMMPVMPVAPMKNGGKVKKMAKGGKARGDGACIKGKTRGAMK
jgi:hypothetical protein